MPLAMGDDNSVLLQYIGGQFEQGTDFARSGDLSGVAVDLQHSSTAKEHGPLQNPEEPTSNTSTNAGPGKNQQSSFDINPDGSTDSRKGDKLAGSMTGLQARQRRIHMDYPAVIQFWLCVKVDLVTRQENTEVGTDSTEHGVENWSTANCITTGSSPDSSHQGSGHRNGFT
jgi:hypothetical protein